MDITQKLQQLLNEPLPGLRAQIDLSPVRSEALRYYSAPAQAKAAAVMCLLHLKENRWHLTYIQRSLHEADYHSGQISFPGGKQEDHDQSLLDCAVRETYEEIGVPRNQIKVLGSLSPIYVYASQFLVHPFVGMISEIPSYVRQTNEVAKVLEAPIDLFRSPDVIKYKDLNIRGHLLKDVPYFDLEGQVLWGATAMITRELTNIWDQLID